MPNKSKRLINTSALREQIVENYDINVFCDTFGIKISTNDGSQIRAMCPLHGGNNESAFSILYDQKGAKCFHWWCRTGCQAHGDIIDFVIRKNSCSFWEACEALMDLVGIDKNELDRTEINQELLQERKDLSAFHREIVGIMEDKETPRVVPTEYINEDFIQRCLERRNDYFKNRGFLDSTLDLFEIGFCPAYDSPWKTCIERPQRVTIPLRDENFRLTGISGRVLKEHETIPKYKIVKGSNKRDILYGLHFTAPYIVESREVVVVEGFSDLWRCWEAGIKNVVALTGKDILPFHINKILSMCHSVVNALDVDKFGLVGKQKLNETFRDLITVKDIDFGSCKDIGDMSIDDVKNSFNNLTK